MTHFTVQSKFRGESEWNDSGYTHLETVEAARSTIDGLKSDGQHGGWSYRIIKIISEVVK